MALSVFAGIVFLEFILLLVSAFFFFVLLTLVVSGSLEVPFVPTPRKALPVIYNALAIEADDIVYELGSGDARFLIEAAAMYPRSRFVGVERNPLLHARALLYKRFKGNPRNVELRRGDLFKTDITGATKIYAYLLMSIMDELLPTFERDFHGTLASRAFPFEGKAPVSIVALSNKPGRHGQHLLYVYEF